MPILRKLPRPDEGSAEEELLKVLAAYRSGDFSASLPDRLIGSYGKIADFLKEYFATSEQRSMEFGRVIQAITNGDFTQKMSMEINGKSLDDRVLRNVENMNNLVNQLSIFSSEINRAVVEISVEGKFGGRANVSGVSGVWKEVTDNINALSSKLTEQIRNLTEVNTAVANGDLTRRVTVDARGEFQQLKEIINSQVERLFIFTSELSRVAREVGTEGKLGGQAIVPQVSGVWKEVTDNINALSLKLAEEIRNIAEVNIAATNGDLSRRVTVDARGEFQQLKEIVNQRGERLSKVASEVSRIAREVGAEGKLGGQAIVPGLSGVWKDLTDNVNLLASSLTNQVRSVSQVATAVISGDLERSVTMDALGEVAELKDNVNAMIQALRDTSHKNQEQDWLKTNLANFSELMQGQKDIETLSKTVLSALAPLVNELHGVFYTMEENLAGEPVLKMISSYAYKERKSISREWKLGEGLVGQCALEKKRILFTNVPDDYIQVTSGLGESKPASILVLPILFEGNVNAVIELASFKPLSAVQLDFLDRLGDSVGVVLNNVLESGRKEELLRRSQSLSDELQAQQEELRETNQELEEQAQQLEEQAEVLREQKLKVEEKNQEVERAKILVEEKASQLELTSKYKSEFLSNMSHELRTPLNSLLILSQHLAENPNNHLDAKEVEFAQLVHVSGNDLLALINEILDLSKIESGTVTLDLAPVPFATVNEQIEKTFRHVAEKRGIGLDLTFADDLPPAFITDEMRLLQVLKNLLSNALKFTEQGKISVSVCRADSGWNPGNKNLNASKNVVALVVKDTGIGISPDKQQIIFEAFQQADGRTSRKYGGTGLGLSISREIARLLGGELALAQSTLQEGSTFVLYLPLESASSTEVGTTQGGQSRQVTAPQSDEGRTINLDQGPINEGRRESVAVEAQVDDDRNAILENDRVILIVEDDPIFARILLDLAREKGFKGVIAMQGRAAIDFLRTIKIDAITLDLNIPDVDGWAILDIVKRDPKLCHIPVDVISGLDESQRGLAQGAFHYLTKPVSMDQLNSALDSIRDLINRPIKNLILVGLNDDDSKEMAKIPKDDEVVTHHLRSGKAALVTMRKQPVDCVVVTKKLSDMSGFDLITQMNQDNSLSQVPVVFYSSAPFTDLEKEKIEKFNASGVLEKVDSFDRMLDQTSFFLHGVDSEFSKDKSLRPRDLPRSKNDVNGRKILIVDDDPRNVTALSATLEYKGATILSAEDGIAGIDLLKRTPGIDIVLMDIMMPEMDGYEVMREIRKLPEFEKLPIIALTAKAMVGDREKCIEAGASDYLSKPLNIEQLISLMQVWLSN